MASSLLPVLVCMVALAAGAARGATDPVAPAPAPEVVSLTGILEKGSQYTTLLRLLKETQIGKQLESQLNNSYNGFTVFAPTDNAFNGLKAGTLNKLTEQEQVALVLYHVLPRYYTFDIFQTASNPISTQATGNNGVFTLNITSTGPQQANISTGVNTTPINNALYKFFPLAVYSIEAVLLPSDLFGVRRTMHPSPPPPPTKAASAPSNSSADGAEVAPEKSPAAALRAPTTALGES
ncbi:unnamed protein product [Spirodela intermedia]|uniref:FAS1 domain-containing protein n=1 Tax=Spirodela intermedia TaxID=51605 RepID=A0A7I8JN87_SPIIN|nr:unnamed protein product [Spirodela intermedia]CAA6671540.1 unnamed protein product [Spirodela intermedia]